MLPLRTLRRIRNLTLIDLALQAGVPARDLAAAEHGVGALDADAQRRIAAILDVEPSAIAALTRPREATPVGTLKTQRLLISVCMCATLLLSMVAALVQSPAPTRASTRPTAAPAAPATQPTAPSSTPSSARTTPMTTTAVQQGLVVLPGVLGVQPTPRQQAALSARPAEGEAPHGCPLLAASDRIVITQGYDTGSHAPAAIWGALDLALDADGDGQGDPDATRGLVVLAASSGVAKVTMDSWPGGNFVRISDERSGWATAYAHLDALAVADGQRVAAGTPIGTVGTTGDTSGPHLHYEIWHGTSNLDPAPFLPCGRAP
jgi:murein DD-endopeptidase MepM/ murein hydrolase activator NlpD